MDLVAGAAHIIVAMEHNAQDGVVVHDVVMELHVAPEGLVVKEILEGRTNVEIEQRGGGAVQFAADLRPMPASRDGELAQSSTQPDVRSLACPR